MTANAAPSVRVLSMQTTLLGNRTYGDLLRRLLARSVRVDFHARWSPDETELRTRGLRTFFWRRAPSRWVRERNLDFFKARYELGTSFLARGALATAVRDVVPDVVHVHAQSIALLSNDVMRMLPCVISADMTARQTADQEAPPGSRWTYEVSHWLEGRVLRNASAVVTLSRWAADAMIADYALAPERVHAIPPGTDLHAFDAIRRARRPRAAGEALSILFVGGQFERKGGDLLARVFIERFSGRNVRLHLVTHATNVPAHDQISVHRDVTPFSPAWCALYAEADVFVMPTRRDASPHVFVEAMASGIPAIGTAVGSIPEAVADNETGYIIAPDDGRALADRIERLLDDAALRARFGAAGLARAQRMYDATHNIEQLERLFVDVARKHRVP